MLRLRELFALLLPICLSTTASAQIIPIMEQTEVLSMSTNWQETRSLNQFNPALGDLKAIRFTAEGTVIGSVAFESLDASSSVVTLNWLANITVRRADTMAVVATAMPQFMNISQQGPFDGTIDNRGPSGQSFPNLFETDSQTVVFNAPFSADTLNLFVGTGAIDFNIDAVGAASATGPGNVAIQFSTDASAKLTVVYEYEGIRDCNMNRIPDEDDIAAMTSMDCNQNGIPDECEFDCNDNGIPDDCDPEECPCFEFNRREPGSLLLFPIFRNGPGLVTLYTVTNSNCEAINGVTDVEFRYIDGDSCLEANESEFFTPCDTISFLTTAHTGPIGEGYAYCYAKKNTSSPQNPAGVPQVFNHLVGQLMVVDAWKSLDYSINAVSFKGVGLQGAPTDRDGPRGMGDGIRDLDDEEYEPAPDRLYIPRFLGQDLGQRAGVHSELLMVNLSGGAAFRATPGNPTGGTIINILGYNDNEIVFSAEHTFSCWDRVPLLNINGSFGNASLRGFNDDPNEILGWNTREAGWFKVNGGFSSSTVESIADPAVYVVLVEQIRGKSASDLPFEFCSQQNGDLLPLSIFGDYPFVIGDNQ